MKKKWGKGDPVSLSDLLKITPVANEILHLTEELNMSTADLMWIVSQILENSNELDEHTLFKNTENEDASLDEEWDDIDLENMEEEIDQALYMINVKVNSTGRFPEIGFKAGINDKEDITYFFDMIVEMLDKLE